MRNLPGASASRHQLSPAISGTAALPIEPTFHSSPEILETIVIKKFNRVYTDATVTLDLEQSRSEFGLIPVR